MGCQVLYQYRQKIFTKRNCCFRIDVYLCSASTLPLSVGREAGYNQINHWRKVSKTLTFLCVLLPNITIWVETEISFRHSITSVDQIIRCFRVININERNKGKKFPCHQNIAPFHHISLKHESNLLPRDSAAQQLRHLQTANDCFASVSLDTKVSCNTLWCLWGTRHRYYIIIPNFHSCLSTIYTLK